MKGRQLDRLAGGQGRGLALGQKARLQQHMEGVLRYETPHQGGSGAGRREERTQHGQRSREVGFSRWLQSSKAVLVNRSGVGKMPWGNSWSELLIVSVLMSILESELKHLNGKKNVFPSDSVASSNTCDCTGGWFKSSEICCLLKL